MVSIYTWYLLDIQVLLDGIRILAAACARISKENIQAIIITECLWIYSWCLSYEIKLSCKIIAFIFKPIGIYNSK